MGSTYATGLTVGSLVRLREREWVVLFLDDQDVLSLRPLSGRDSETCGVHLALEGDSVQPASFPMPDARDLIERGDARRVCVLCPPHLCDQWQRELADKFHIDAVIVRTSTVARLERAIPRKDISLFRYYLHLIVSIDFAKSDRRRTMFVQECPDLVIVDEVHAAADPGARGSREQQQRHELLCALAKNQQRHLLLMSATPHSGFEDSFRSLLGLVRPEFAQLNLQGLTETERRT